MYQGSTGIAVSPARKARENQPQSDVIRGRALSRIEVRRRPGRQESNGLLLIAGRAFPCILGRQGMTARKREGDWQTPLGDFRLKSVYWRRDRTERPQTLLPVQPIQRCDGWCDEPADPRYNRPVTLPIRSSAECLWREDGLYDICIVTSQNWHPRKRAGGSAIFLHLTAEKPYTAGCVAMDGKTLRYLLARCGPQTRLIISRGI